MPGSETFTLLMDLLAFNDKVFAQTVFIADAPKGKENPAVAWAALKGASCAPLQHCTFAEVKNVSLTLLYPTARPLCVMVSSTRCDAMCGASARMAVCLHVTLLIVTSV